MDFGPSIIIGLFMDAVAVGIAGYLATRTTLRSALKRLVAAETAHLVTREVLEDRLAPIHRRIARIQARGLDPDATNPGLKLSTPRTP